MNTDSRVFPAEPGAAISTCPVCERTVRRHPQGSLYLHNSSAHLGSPCPGSGGEPVVTIVPVEAS